MYQHSKMYFRFIMCLMWVVQNKKFRVEKILPGRVTVYTTTGDVLICGFFSFKTIAATGTSMSVRTGPVTRRVVKNKGKNKVGVLVNS
jgi:hypothetical protein